MKKLLLILAGLLLIPVNSWGDIYSTAKVDSKTEIQELRSERSKVFLLPNGSKRHLCFGAPIHYKPYTSSRAGGGKVSWGDIDIRLQHVPATGRETHGKYTASKNKFQYEFRDDRKSDKSICIRRGPDNQMEWTVKTVKLGGVEKVVPTNFTSIEKTSDFSFEHRGTDFDLVTDFNEVHIRTAVKTKVPISDFLIQEIISLKGIKVLNKKEGKEYLAENGEFRFKTTDGESLWIPRPTMWVETEDEDSVSQEITHRLFEEGGKLIYEKVPTEKGKAWLVSKSAPVFIDGDTYTGSTGDGWILKNGSPWSTIRSATSGNQHVAVDDYRSHATRAKGAWDNYYIYRTFLFFDTSGVANTPTSCDLKIRGYSLADSDVSAQKSTISGTTVDNNNQYNDFSGSEYGHVSWVASAWNTISFNSTGLNDISLAGYTKICCREYTHEYSDSAPSGFEGGESFSNGFYFAEHATYKPYLDIVESVPFIPQIIMF